MGRIGSRAIDNGFGRCLSQLPDYSHVRLARYDCDDRPATRLWDRHRRADPSIVPSPRRQSVVSPPLARSPQSRHPSVPGSDETSGANQSPDAGLRLLHVVESPLGEPPGQDHRDSIQRRSTGASPTPAWVFHPSPQTYPQRQAERGRVCQSQEATGQAQKKR
jgi:hypothetical protein